jgi:DNA-binding transcriptional regulator YbjK
MDKQIKELATEILQEFTSCYSEADEDCLVEMIRKYIPEGAVVISKEQNENWLSFLEQNIEKARKEAVEKFAERLKPTLQEWLEDNEDMAGKIDFGVATIDLIGVKSLDGEVIAESLIDEIAKEFTEEKNGKSNKP